MKASRTPQTQQELRYSVKPILHKIDIFTSFLLVFMRNRSSEGGQTKKTHGQPKKQNWLPKGHISKEVSVEHWSSCVAYMHAKTLSSLL